MTAIPLGERPLVLADVTAAARGGADVRMAPHLRERMVAARAVLDEHLAKGIPVYGLNTGLGGNIGHRIGADEAAGLQAAMVSGRVAGVGAPLPIETCRAVLFCRIAGLAQGGAGISPQVFDLLCAMLRHDVIPVIPSIGSTGASDLVQTMSLAAAAIGQGAAYAGGTIRPAGSALEAVGLRPARLAPKDALSIGSASSVGVASGALALAALDDLLAVHAAVAALACQALGASPHIFDARVVAARPAAGQVEAASRFRRLLAGGDFFERRPAKVQDAISFRALPQVTGTLIGAFRHAREEVEIELNAAADNPIVLADGARVLPSANFLTASLALAFDTAAIAVAQFATASAQRTIKLMTGRLSGLANYLSPVGGASAGFVPMQKSLASLHAVIRLKAAPASLDGIVVSEMVEDIATNSVLAIAKLNEQLEPLRWMVSIEALVAAQAVDLRRADEPGLRLDIGSAAIHDAVRRVVPMLETDRPTGPDAAEVHQRLWQPEHVAAIRALLDEGD